MMRLFCVHCDRFIDVDNFAPRTRTGEVRINGQTIHAQEEYGVCPICGSDIYTNEMIDRNTSRAHNAYRRAQGSITGEEIQEILKMYHIGAQPLSRLLGWGENTIERQIKHTIPDRERAQRLRRLKTPSAMLALLEANRNLISEAAYRKARRAAVSLLAEAICKNAVGLIAPAGKLPTDLSAIIEYPPRIADCVFPRKARQEHRTGRLIRYKDDNDTAIRKQYQLVFQGGHSHA